MYKAYRGKKEIILWCEKENSSRGGTRKRAHSPDNNVGPAKSSRYASHLEKMTEVGTIEDKLKKIHNNDGVKYFSDEQLRSWAHLIQMGKHMSYNTPPKNPFGEVGKQPPHQGMQVNTHYQILPRHLPLSVYLQVKG